MDTVLSPGQSRRLRDGCQTLGTTISDAQLVLLDRYLGLFAKWNKAYNLSSIRQLDDMVGRHILDSLSVLTYLDIQKEQRFVDVGTGGGLPGIPLAIALPQWHWTLLDSNGKKTRFLTEVVSRLALPNVQVVNQRVESFAPQPPFDGVISRAFASLVDMVQGCRHLVRDQGLLWAMKGQFPAGELAQLPADVQLRQSWSLQVPGEVGERHLIQLSID